VKNTVSLSYENLRHLRLNYIKVQHKSVVTPY